MFCTNCGKQLVDTSKFCMYCGANIEKSSMPVITQTEKTTMAKPKDIDNTEALPTITFPGDMDNAADLPTITFPTDIEIEIELPDMGSDIDHKIMENIRYNDIFMENNENDNLITESIVPHNHTEKSNSVDSQTRTKKTLNKRILFTLPILAVFLIGVGIIGYLVNQNYINKQSDEVILLFDEGQYEESLFIYEKYSDKKDSFNNNIVNELSSRADLIKENYLAEVIEYSDASKKLQAISDYDDRELSQDVTAITNWVNLIYNSRINYKLAESLYEKGDYEGAVKRFKLVIAEDPAYYTLASEKIADAEEVLNTLEQQRLEEEHINNIRDNTLAKALTYENSYDYASAVAAVEEGLLKITDDKRLLDKLSYYQNLHSMTLKVSDITSIFYEDTYKEGDLDLLTVNIQIPVLVGEFPTYDRINRVFENLKTDKIASCKSWAEDIREYATDESFYTNSLDFNFTTNYNNNGILCIMMNGYSYTGGAHGYPIREIYTFDLISGEQLGLEDLIATDENTFWPYVVTEFEKIIAANPVDYWEDALTTIGTREMEFSTMDYSLQEDGICIFYYPYELSSFAQGFVEAVIPYSGNEWMFTFLSKDK